MTSHAYSNQTKYNDTWGQRSLMGLQFSSLDWSHRSRDKDDEGHSRGTYRW